MQMDIKWPWSLIIESLIPDFTIRSESAKIDLFSKSRLHALYANKGRFKCKKSGMALKYEEDAVILYGYAGQHSEECRPSSAVLHFKRIRDAIKQQVLVDPTAKPIAVSKTWLLQRKWSLTTSRPSSRSWMPASLSGRGCSARVGVPNWHFWAFLHSRA